MGIRKVDYVLLTHIHIDHAGGLAPFLENFPTARIICHKEGVRHLVDPSRLWAGSRKVLGDLVDAYGPIRPVEERAFLPHTQVDLDDLEVIETPGHAIHHLSYIWEKNLLVGEAGGLHLRIGEKTYTRPTTPPVFFLRDFVASIDRLLEREDMPVCFAHYGRGSSSHRCLTRAREQIFLWERIIRRELRKSPLDPIAACLEALLTEDPHVQAYQDMSPAEQKRERVFIDHCIQGYMGYVGREGNEVTKRIR
jgi:glyoxylase-like metal-dependent hydrolase (beta-lactamase superfamily II)